MRKKIIISFLFLFLVFFVTHDVRADYASDYQTYVNKGGLYQTAYSDYVRARLNYLSSQSLESQNKAMQATIAMLQARDGLMVSYLTAINTKIQTTKGMDTGVASSLSNQLNTEVTWYNAHSIKIPSAGNLQDLVSDSDEAKAEYNNLTVSIIYSSLVSLGIANNTYIRDELTSELSTLNAKIAEIKANQDKDTSTIERSVIDVQNKLSRSLAKDNTAKDLVNGIKPTDQQKSSIFQTAQSNLTDSNSYLKEANQQLLQIISQIKSAN